MEEIPRIVDEADAAREDLDRVLTEGFHTVPHCLFLYAVNTDGIQISDNVSIGGLLPEHYGRDRSQRPYMREAVPSWGFLLSDAYLSQSGARPSLTALQVVQRGGQTLGYLAADFDLRDLPVTAELCEESGGWRQIKGDPAIRGLVFQQHRVESLLDHNMETCCAILEELLTERGMFQGVIHFSSSRATIWLMDDPYRYRILDHEALSDPDICLLYPRRPYPQEAVIPRRDIVRILETLQRLRVADDTFYLRMASINIFNGLVGLNFSCDGSHYIPVQQFLARDSAFWEGIN